MKVQLVEGHIRCVHVTECKGVWVYERVCVYKSLCACLFVYCNQVRYLWPATERYTWFQLPDSWPRTYIPLNAWPTTRVCSAANYTDLTWLHWRPTVRAAVRRPWARSAWAAHRHARHRRQCGCAYPRRGHPEMRTVLWSAVLQVWKSKHIG